MLVRLSISAKACEGDVDGEVAVPDGAESGDEPDGPVRGLRWCERSGGTY